MIDNNNFCFNCGKQKEEYESLYCDNCWEEEQQRLNNNQINITINKELLNDKDIDFFHYGCSYEVGNCKLGKLFICSRGELKCEYIDEDRGIETRNYDDIVRYYVSNNEEYIKAINDGKLNCLLNNWFELELVDNDGNYLCNIYEEVFGSISECINTLKEDIEKNEDFVKIISDYIV